MIFDLINYGEKMDLRKHLIAGNWKMNGTLDSISEILKIDKLCNG